MSLLDQVKDLAQPWEVLYKNELAENANLKLAVKQAYIDGRLDGNLDIDFEKRKEIIGLMVCSRVVADAQGSTGLADKLVAMIESLGGDS